MDIQDELYEAAWRGDIERIGSLIAAGANTKSDSSYVLRQAAMNGKTECVAFLIPLTEPKANCSEALLRAAERGHIECLRLLIPVSDTKAARARLTEDQHFDALALLDSVIQEEALKSKYLKPTLELARMGL